MAVGRGLAVLGGTAVTDGSGNVSSVGKGSGIQNVEHASGLYTVTLDCHVNQVLFAEAVIMLDTDGSALTMQVDAVTTGKAGTAQVVFNAVTMSTGAVATGGVVSATLGFLILVSKSSVPGGGLT
jgi:hypothetical protein